MSDVVIRALGPGDWTDVEVVYRAGIASGHATFEAEPPTWESFDLGKLPDLRFVAVEHGRVVGWVAAGATSNRAVYRGVIEHSVYVDPDTRGRGIGGELLEHLCAAAGALGYWTIQSSIFPENEASLRLHDRNGFRRIGTRERIALMTYGPLAGQWRDTVLVERRSCSAGA